MDTRYEAYYDGSNVWIVSYIYRREVNAHDDEEVFRAPASSLNEALSIIRTSDRFLPSGPLRMDSKRGYRMFSVALSPNNY